MQNGIISLIPDKQPSLYVVSLNERPAHPIRMAIYPNDRIDMDIVRTEYNFQCRATGSEMVEGITDYMQTLRPTNDRIDSLFLLLEASPPSDTHLLPAIQSTFRPAPVGISPMDSGTFVQSGSGNHITLRSARFDTGTLQHTPTRRY